MERSSALDLESRRLESRCGTVKVAEFSLVGDVVSEALFLRRNLRISQLVRHRRGNCEHLTEACVSANSHGWRERACLDVRRSSGRLKAKKGNIFACDSRGHARAQTYWKHQNIKRVPTAGPRMEMRSNSCLVDSRW